MQPTVISREKKIDFFFLCTQTVYAQVSTLGFGNLLGKNSI